MEMAYHHTGPDDRGQWSTLSAGETGDPTQAPVPGGGIRGHDHRLKPKMWKPSRLLLSTLALTVVLAACGAGAATTDTPGEDLPVTSANHFEAHLADIDKPAIVNVWASWCLPCRAEAPLLEQAFQTYGSEVEFIGIDVQDNQPDARAFLAEFGLGFDHFFDKNREIANHYAGIGTPITFFFGPGGELITTHNGVIDERTLALNIDELMNLS